jgi:hypothetical protein
MPSASDDYGMPSTSNDYGMPTGTGFTHYSIPTGFNNSMKIDPTSTSMMTQYTVTTPDSSNNNIIEITDLNAVYIINPDSNVSSYMILI